LFLVFCWATVRLFFFFLLFPLFPHQYIKKFYRSQVLNIRSSTKQDS
jgi:hypothetical protein